MDEAEVLRKLAREAHSRGDTEEAEQIEDEIVELFR